MAILSRDEIERIGFASVGRNVQLSDRASFYGVASIRIGDNVRIDDFCILSAGAGGICIGCRVHIAAYSSLIGAGAIIISDYSNLSSRVSIYSSSDDYSGGAMTNPMIPMEYTNVTISDVFLGKHVIVGAGTVILPGAILEEGVAIGALSLVRGTCETFGIYGGVPARRIKERKRNLLNIEAQLRAADA
jgi:galactoside O-acetyltransferase